MERTTLIDSIVAEIRDRIISGELKEGETLAPRMIWPGRWGLIKDEAESVERTSKVKGERSDV